MPQRRYYALSPWLRAGALAALLALTACDNGPEQTAGEKAPADNGAPPQNEPPAKAAPTGKLETRQETLRRRADNCSGDDCAKVAVDLELYEGHPELNQAVRRRMVRQLGGDGEDQGAPPRTLEEAAERFLNTAAGIPGDGARGWELSGESRQLGRWKDLLTVAIDSYEFTGGAHGLPVTRWLNWDLAAHRPVPWKRPRAAPTIAGWKRKWIPMRTSARPGRSRKAATSGSPARAWCCITTSIPSPPM